MRQHNTPCWRRTADAIYSPHPLERMRRERLLQLKELGDRQFPKPISCVFKVWWGGHILAFKSTHHLEKKKVGVIHGWFLNHVFLREEEIKISEADT